MHGQQNIEQKKLEYSIQWERSYSMQIDGGTDGPGSKPDQKYARRRDRQNYIRKNKEQIGLE